MCAPAVSLEQEAQAIYRGAEKNPRPVFDDNDGGGAALWFDEARAHFGKRCKYRIAMTVVPTLR